MICYDLTGLLLYLMELPFGVNTLSVYDETLHPEPLSYRVWGREHIDDQSLRQMDNAMRLPITVSGALMPDAHVGYGLPIGGVLATEGAVIPYAVGVDIACRMRISVFPQSGQTMDSASSAFMMRR